MLLFQMLDCVDFCGDMCVFEVMLDRKTTHNCLHTLAVTMENMSIFMGQAAENKE